VSSSMPKNETKESREAAFRRRIQRFAGVEISAGFDTVPPRPELVPQVSDQTRFETRVERFVLRQEKPHKSL
jgi:hypothetical protein